MFGEVQSRYGGTSASFTLGPVIVSIGGGGSRASGSISRSIQSGDRDRRLGITEVGKVCLRSLQSI
jgi:hypothetical protein